MSALTPEEIMAVENIFAVHIEELSEEVRKAWRWVAVNIDTKEINEKHETTVYWRRLQAELFATVTTTDRVLAKLKGDAA